MEQKTVVEVECPKCGSSGKARIKQFIDAQADPKGRKDLLAGKLNVYRCRSCSFTDSLPADVFYHDPEKGFCVQYAPRWRTEEDEFLDGLDDRAQPAFLGSGCGSDAPAYLRDVHLVLSMNELASYVVFRERLWKRRASVDHGLVTCFSCDRSIEHAEHYYCVSRAVRERSGQDQHEDRILDSTSSLQVCADCRKKAETKPITFDYAPMPLLNLERDGFRRFARERGNWASLRQPEAPRGDSCGLCRSGIGQGDRYVTIELSEEISSPEGVETLEVHALLATVCGRCSEQYMVWLSLAECADQQESTGS
jgi:hypothetical protein